jgi:hypothetical protein
LLAGKYNLVCTNVPYLARGKQNRLLRDFAERHFAGAKQDLATVFLQRCLELSNLSNHSSCAAIVVPQNWLFLDSYRVLRIQVLTTSTIFTAVRLGPGAFETIGGEIVNIGLFIIGPDLAPGTHALVGIDCTDAVTPDDKASAVRRYPVSLLNQGAQQKNPDARILLSEHCADNKLLQSRATFANGIQITWDWDDIFGSVQKSLVGGKSSKVQSLVRSRMVGGKV